LFNVSRSSGGTANELFNFFGVDKTNFKYILPLTNLQNNIAFEIAVNDALGLYNVGVALECTGVADVSRLRDSLSLLVKSEETMRTVFVQKDDLVFQGVKIDSDKNLEYHDLSGFHHNNNEILGIIKQKCESPFLQMIGDELWNLFIIKQSDDKYWITFSTSQLLNDFASSALLFERLTKVNKVELNSDIDLKYSGFHFRDYIFSNNEEFNTPDVLSFWQNKLSDVHELPLAGGSENPASDFITQHLNIPDGKYKEIKRFCMDMGITISFYVKLLYSILLEYYFKTGSSFLLYQNFHGREKAHLNTLGVCFHPLPVVVPGSLLANYATLVDLINYFKKYRTDTEAVEKISMQYLNTFLATRGMKPVLNYINLAATCTLPNSLNAYAIENLGNHNEINFLIEERECSLDFHLGYHASTFTDNDFLQRLIHLSDQLSAGVCELNKLEFILNKEKVQIASYTSIDHGRHQQLSFISHFERQVADTPLNIAVEYANCSLSYHDLNEKANQLANYIQNYYQILPGDLVAVYMNRSHEVLIAMIAIFKARAVYLPIDASLPKQRGDTILGISRPKLIILSANHLTKIDCSGMKVFAIDLQLKNLTTSGDNLSLKPTNEELSYVIFTSGSTGEPKGVMIEHKGMINHIFEKVKDFEIDGTSIVAQTASLSFDISVWQFLAPLVVGGKTIVYDSETVSDVYEFVATLSNDSVTIFELVPSLLSLIVRAGLPGSDLDLFSNLRYLLVTGDVLSVSVANEWVTRFPNITLSNVYGPTETSDDITHFKMSKVLQGKTVPIGKPIANVHIEILDDNGHLCPPGFKGEILVSGLSVSRGYLNCPEKDMDVFENVDDHMRRYHTGDIGSWTKEGHLLFHGRKDSQIKIRGMRVEPGEVEQHINHLSGIEEAVVIVAQSEQDEKTLIGFFKSGQQQEIHDIRKQLSKRIPGYMVPSALIQIEEWPLTNNGKIDRYGLMQMCPSTHGLEYIRPETELQHKIVKLWEEVLDKTGIGIHANFFEIGGHSIKAMELVSRFYEVFGIKLELKLIFSHSTVCEMAHLIEAKNWLLDDNKGHNIQEILL